MFDIREEKKKPANFVKALTSICARLGKFQEELVQQAGLYEEGVQEEELELHRIRIKVEEATGKKFHEIPWDDLDEEVRSELEYHTELKERVKGYAQNVWEILDLFSTNFETYMWPDWDE